MTVAALRQGHPEALEDLLATYGRELQGVAYLILRDRADAEDVVAETLITAYERIGSLRDERALRAWLLRIAANHALTLRRGSARVVRLHVLPDRPAVGDLGSDAVSRVALLSGVADLPPRMRAAVVLRYYADLSVEDVARTLGTSPNTVKAQLQTALDRLRLALSDGSRIVPEASNA